MIICKYIQHLFDTLLILRSICEEEREGKKIVICWHHANLVMPVCVGVAWVYSAINKNLSLPCLAWMSADQLILQEVHVGTDHFYYFSVL